MTKEYKQFDTVLVDFGNDVIDSEQGGIRPAIIIQNDVGNKYSPTTIVIPFTSKLKNLNQPTHCLFGKDMRKGLHEDSLLLGECVRQVSEKRIKKRLGSIDDKTDRTKIRRVYNANFGE